MEDKVIDITGIELTPGEPDVCLGNGEHTDEAGELIECCCDECDYLMVCSEKWEKNKNS
jgi:hypothetical protein